MDKLAESFTNMFFRSARKRARQRDLRAAGERIKNRIAFSNPRTLNVGTGVITPSSPNAQGKAIAEAINSALERGSVKRVKIF